LRRLTTTWATSARPGPARSHESRQFLPRRTQ
jgi:hypothetical protein